MQFYPNYHLEYVAKKKKHSRSTQNTGKVLTQILHIKLDLVLTF